MKQMEPPKCRLCEKNHWAREGCDFGKKLTQLEQTGKVLSDYAKRNIQREGRRVLKGSTSKAPGAKPTRSASTEKADPCTPARALIGPRSEPAASGARSERTPAATGRPVSKRKKKPPKEVRGE